MTVNKETLLKTTGEFLWFWGYDWFIETEIGNFHWKDPDYNGDNTIRLFEGDYEAFRKTMNAPYGRGKGKHLIETYCGKDFELVETESISND